MTAGAPRLGVAPSSLAGFDTAVLSCCATEVGAGRRRLRGRLRSPEPCKRWALGGARVLSCLDGLALSLQARGPAPGQGRYGVPQYAVGAAGCLVLSAPPVASRGPCLKSAVNQSLRSFPLPFPLLHPPPTWTNIHLLLSFPSPSPPSATSRSLSLTVPSNIPPWTPFLGSRNGGKEEI